MSLRGMAREWATTSTTIQRGGRYERFVELWGFQPGDRILDGGVGVGAALERFNSVNPIVALDLTPKTSPWLEQENVTTMVGDGTRLQFADGEFAVAFSNSVIEHVPLELQ